MPTRNSIRTSMVLAKPFAEGQPEVFDMRASMEKLPPMEDPVFWAICVSVADIADRIGLGSPGCDQLTIQLTINGVQCPFSELVMAMVAGYDDSVRKAAEELLAERFAATNDLLYRLEELTKSAVVKEEVRQWGESIQPQEGQGS